MFKKISIVLFVFYFAQMGLACSCGCGGGGSVYSSASESVFAPPPPALPSPNYPGLSTGLKPFAYRPYAAPKPCFPAPTPAPFPIPCPAAAPAPIPAPSFYQPIIPYLKPSPIEALKMKIAMAKEKLLAPKVCMKNLMMKKFGGACGCGCGCM